MTEFEKALEEHIETNIVQLGFRIGANWAYEWCKRNEVGPATVRQVFKQKDIIDSYTEIIHKQDEIIEKLKSALESVRDKSDMCPFLESQVCRCVPGVREVLKEVETMRDHAT